MGHSEAAQNHIQLAKLLDNKYQHKMAVGTLFYPCVSRQPRRLVGVIEDCLLRHYKLAEYFTYTVFTDCSLVNTGSLFTCVFPIVCFLNILVSSQTVGQAEILPVLCCCILLKQAL